MLLPITAVSCCVRFSLNFPIKIIPQIKIGCPVQTIFLFMEAGWSASTLDERTKDQMGYHAQFLICSAGRLNKETTRPHTQCLHSSAHHIGVETYGPPLAILDAQQFDIKNFKLFRAKKRGRSHLQKIWSSLH